MVHTHAPSRLSGLKTSQQTKKTVHEVWRDLFGARASESGNGGGERLALLRIVLGFGASSCQAMNLSVLRIQGSQWGHGMWDIRVTVHFIFTVKGTMVPSGPGTVDNKVRKT